MISPHSLQGAALISDTSEEGLTFVDAAWNLSSVTPQDKLGIVVYQTLSNSPGSTIQTSISGVQLDYDAADCPDSNSSVISTPSSTPTAPKTSAPETSLPVFILATTSSLSLLFLAFRFSRKPTIEQKP